MDPYGHQLYDRIDCIVNPDVKVVCQWATGTWAIARQVELRHEEKADNTREHIAHGEMVRRESDPPREVDNWLRYRDHMDNKMEHAMVDDGEERDEYGT